MLEPTANKTNITSGIHSLPDMTQLLRRRENMHTVNTKMNDSSGPRATDPINAAQKRGASSNIENRGYGFREQNSVQSSDIPIIWPEPIWVTSRSGVKEEVTGGVVTPNNNLMLRTAARTCIENVKSDRSDSDLTSKSGAKNKMPEMTTNFESFSKPYAGD